MSEDGSKVVPVLWMEKDGAAVAEYYASVFPQSHVVHAGFPISKVSIWGQMFHIMEAGKHHEFNDAVSFSVTCKDQEELDLVWDRLLADGGKELGPAWIADRYGVRWQLIPKGMVQLMNGPNVSKVQAAMMTMKKIVLSELESASKN